MSVLLERNILYHAKKPQVNDTEYSIIKRKMPKVITISSSTKTNVSSTRRSLNLTEKEIISCNEHLENLNWNPFIWKNIYEYVETQTDNPWILKMEDQRWILTHPEKEGKVKFIASKLTGRGTLPRELHGIFPTKRDNVYLNDTIESIKVRVDWTY
jgi:hypothetical protein